jgi:hypothetical protein
VSNVPVRALCIRRKTRHQVASDGRICLELAPGVMRDRRFLPLRDISLAGVSFAIQRAPSGMHRFALLPEIVLHVDGLVIEGDLLIAHITPDDERFICGGTFHPLTDEDAAKLARALESLGKPR